MARRSRVQRIFIPVVLALAAGVLLAACGGDGGGGSAKDKQELEDQARQLAGSGPEQIDYFLNHVTDNVLTNFFNFTREECRQNAQDCVGDPSTEVSVSNTKLSGDKGSLDIAIEFGAFHAVFVREDGVWKLDDLSSIAKEIPSGVKAVDLELKEFSFTFDPSDITDGNFAFKVRNSGDQLHEVVVVKIPVDLDLQAAIASDSEPQGIEDVAFQGPIKADEETTVVFDQALVSGRYALLCFFPDVSDPERPPHAVKGMVSEFTIE